MGVTIEYATTRPAAPDVTALVLQAADETNRGREWWTEGILFFDDPEQPGVLSGSSKLFRGGGVVEVDDDSFLAWRDAQFIISRLAHWGSNFGLVWRLSYDGGELGRVDAAGADHAVTAALSMLLASTPYATSDPLDHETTAAALLKKYADLGLWP
jgi:hypothetical protein